VKNIAQKVALSIFLWKSVRYLYRGKKHHKKMRYFCNFQKTAPEETTAK
jgi:hypothetical protein